MKSTIREAKVLKRKLTKWFLIAISMCKALLRPQPWPVRMNASLRRNYASRQVCRLWWAVPSRLTESLQLNLMILLKWNRRRSVLYATRDGNFLLLNGDLLKVTSSSVSNLSEERRITDRLALIGDLDTNDMIVFSPLEPPKAHITVFTDITCGFCRKLHLEMDDFNRRGIEVRYLAFPRGGMASQGAKQLATAWCARNREATLTSLKSGVEMPLNDCEGNPVAEHYALGNRLGVRGTPAIVTSDGQMIPGYRSASDIASLLGIE